MQFSILKPLIVIPAKAGIQNSFSIQWIPAFTGMTESGSQRSQIQFIIKLGK